MRLLTLFFFLATISGNTFAQQEYLWPTSSGKSLSATFGETRAAHFHAGLDIKTWGKEGYKVFATKDAVLYRIGVSANGYGKVIYLKHNDGSFSIYAHLQAFNEQIQELADSLRFEDYSFELNKVVENYGIRVNQGDVLGYTGSTGIGPPHLHFELRDQFMRPFNALETNLKVKDKLPPVFSSIRIEPADRKAFVKGAKKPVIVRPSLTSDGYYDYGTVESQGHILLSVDVYDEANDVPNKYAVYQLSLLSGTDTLFHSTLSSYDYEHASDMFLDRVIHPETGRRRFQSLYIPAGTTVPFYDRSYNHAVEPPYPRKLTIVASDIYGNESTAFIEISKPLDPKNVVHTSLSNVPLNEINDWVWNNHWASPSPSLAIDLNTKEGAPYTSDLRYQAKNDARLILHPSGQTLYVAHLNPGKTLSISSADRKFRLALPPRTVFQPVNMVIPFNRIDTLAHTLTIFPQDYISKSKFQIQYYIDKNEAYSNQLGLYKYDRFKQEWNFIQSKRVGSTLHGWNNEFGIYAVLPDTSAPEIGQAFVDKNETGSWLIKISVTDDFSGIDYGKSMILVNGVRGIAEYDKEEDLILYYHPEFIPQETNHLFIEVRDKIGNTISKEIEIKKADKSALKKVR